MVGFYSIHPGWNRRQLLNDFYELDFGKNQTQIVVNLVDTLTWKQKPHTGFPFGISQYSMLHKDNILYIFGGFNGQAMNSLFGMKLF